MKHKLYDGARQTLWELDKKDTLEEMNFQDDCDEILRELHRYCDQLELDFRDFKNAFLEKGFFKGEKSFDRILNNGIPRKYIQNLKLFNDFAESIDNAIKHCADGTYILQRSDAEKVRKNYQYYADQGYSLKNKLYQLAVFAMRTNPELRAKEEKAVKIFIQERAAKSFFDGIENKSFEEIQEGVHRYYKIPPSVCHALYDMLKNDTIIMRRLQQRFDRKDYFPFE